MSWRYSLNAYNDPRRHDNSLTGRQLQRVLQYSLLNCRSLQGLRRAECAKYNVDFDEVYPRIYIGDSAAAKNKHFLGMFGITHVLNAAEGCRYGQVDTGHNYYRDMPNIRYMGLNLIDSPQVDISRYFYVAAKYIENAVNSGGKILVHCMVGVSRSATCVLAYLMICRRMSAEEAIRTVCLRRDIRPNDGFLQQLAELDRDLKRKFLFSY